MFEVDVKNVMKGRREGREGKKGREGNGRRGPARVWGSDSDNIVISSLSCVVIFMLV